MSADHRTNAALHFGIAERGKVHALAGEHTEALRHYREAMRLAVDGGAEEVFFRHYTQCVLESLERLGNFDEVLAFCERAEDHYLASPPPHELAVLDRATHWERRGAVLIKLGRADEARDALQTAIEYAGPGRLPLAECLLGWVQRGLRVDARRVLAEQERRDYFIVRKDSVDEARAISLPPGVGTPPVGARR